MSLIPKWILKIVIGLLLLLGLICALIWIWSGYLLNQSYPPVNRPFVVDTENADLDEGKRLARITGCTGCHGENAEGAVMFDSPVFAKIVAPNLTEIVHRYSDRELEVAIRQGISPSGRGLIVMPSAYFSSMRDADLNNIIAYLRSAPKSSNDLGTSSVRLIGRALVIKGDLHTQPQLQQYEPLPDKVSNSTFYEASYIAQLKCAECHGRDLKGAPFGLDVTPSLVSVMGYSRDEFRQLMREGIAKGNREVGLMSEISRTHFSYFSDEEIDDLYRYLVDKNWM